MESDFLNRRNNYKIDDEDAQLALHGYSMHCIGLLMFCRFYIFLFHMQTAQVVVPVAFLILLKVVQEATDAHSHT